MTTTITNLNDLFDSIKSGNTELNDSLPSFGGAEPSSTIEVWSWDETHLLVGACVSELSIESRDEW